MVTELTNYTYWGYPVYKYSVPFIDDLGYGKYNPIYRYCVKLGPDRTEVKFTSLRDAQEWCKGHYLEGVVQGWIKA